MEPWGAAEARNPDNMTVEEIRRKFQLLKKDAAGNHNLLKSRACERCIDTGKRGNPFGIKFYYAGNEDWPADCPNFGPKSEQNCFGCGWYDVAAWREALSKLKIELFVCFSFQGQQQNIHAPPLLISRCVLGHGTR